jgi:hypothetical protein
VNKKFAIKRCFVNLRSPDFVNSISRPLAKVKAISRLCRLLCGEPAAHRQICLNSSRLRLATGGTAAKTIRPLQEFQQINKNLAFQYFGF